MINTSTGVQINDNVICNYFKNLVNLFFKILPLRENGEQTLPVYIRSLQIELIGCKNIIIDLQNDNNIITLISILQYFYDNPDSPISEVKREVFRAIAICNKLKDKYEKMVRQ